MESPLPNIFYDLALILGVAGVITILFRWLKQPVVLGYIVAGFLVGTNFPYAPTVLDIPNIKIWGEMGVIFLFFGLGLEFSFRKLKRVGGHSIVIAIIEITIMQLLGFTLGMILGWKLIDCIFLGAMVSIASTTIIIRVFEEAGIKNERFASLVFGILIVEDIVAVIVLILLPTISISQEFSGWTLFLKVGELFFFLVAWMVIGLFFIPYILKRFSNFFQDEMLLIFSLSICFIMVLLSSFVGFSPALGAFISGSIFAETIRMESIERLMRPMKNLFGAIFFVSVGMLLDLSVLVNYIIPIILITLLVLLGKPIAVFIGSMISGQKLQTSIQTGFSMAQIGEFSFIIAALGISLNVTHDFLSPIVITVSVITAATTPYLINLAIPLSQKIEGSLSKSWNNKLDNYSVILLSTRLEKNWQKIIKSYLIRIIANGVIISIIFIGLKFLVPTILDLLPLETESISKELLSIITLITCFLLSIPFMWAFVASTSKNEDIIDLFRNNRYSALFIIITIIRFAFLIILITFLSVSFFSWDHTLLIFIAVIVVLLIVFTRFFKNIYGRIERQFIANINNESESNGSNLAIIPPWDSHLSVLTISPNAKCIGKSLAELKIREQYKVSIVLIERGDQIVTIPNRDTILFPYDKIYVIGTDEQTNLLFSKIENKASKDDKKTNFNSFEMNNIVINDSSSLCGNTIHDSGLKEKINGIIIGIEKNGNQVLNPDSSVKLEAGDVVLIFGDKELIKEIKEKS